jgi:hypothetical protein
MKRGLFIMLMGISTITFSQSKSQQYLDSANTTINELTVVMDRECVNFTEINALFEKYFYYIETCKIERKAEKKTARREKKEARRNEASASTYEVRLYF